MITSCKNCGKVFEVEDDKFGHTIKCLFCKKNTISTMYVGDKKPLPLLKPKKKKPQRVASKTKKFCPSCGTQIIAKANFCMECGTSLNPKMQKTAKSAPPPEAIGSQVDLIPSSGITIQFAKSTAALFESALSYAEKNAPSFHESTINKKKWYYASWPETDMLEVLKLVESLKGMRNRKVYINGEEQIWKDAFSFTWCVNERKAAYRPAEYCFGIDDDNLNIWGCRNAQMDWQHWAKWFSYGEYKNKNKFVFDKKRIHFELEKNLYRNKYCPYLSTAFAEIVFNLFPSEVKVSLKGAWRYNQLYNETPGAMKIIEKEKRFGSISYNEFWTNGVVPQGISEAKKILLKAINQYGKAKIDLALLK